MTDKQHTMRCYNIIEEAWHKFTFLGQDCYVNSIPYSFKCDVTTLLNYIPNLTTLYRDLKYLDFHHVQDNRVDYYVQCTTRTEMEMDGIAALLSNKYVSMIEKYLLAHLVTIQINSYSYQNEYVNINKQMILRCKALV